MYGLYEQYMPVIIFRTKTLSFSSSKRHVWYKNFVLMAFLHKKWRGGLKLNIISGEKSIKSIYLLKSTNTFSLNHINHKIHKFWLLRKPTIKYRQIAIWQQQKSHWAYCGTYHNFLYYTPSLLKRRAQGHTSYQVNTKPGRTHSVYSRHGNTVVAHSVIK